MGKNQHVVARDKKWAVRGERNKRDTSLHNTQAQAEKAAIKIAKKEHSEVIVHGRNGLFRSKDSYGKDPFPPRDTEH
jgi:uncharacterized protein DUF2188